MPAGHLGPTAATVLFVTHDVEEGITWRPALHSERQTGSIVGCPVPFGGRATGDQQSKEFQDLVH